MAKKGRALADVRLRSLGARETGVSAASRLIDAVRAADGRGFAFFGQGTLPAAFAPDGAEGCARPLELREISGATMVVTEAGPMRLALAEGGTLDLDPAAEETGFLAGLNCILALRLEESAAQVAEGLRHHVLHHRLQGAVIVNRMPDAGFAAALTAAVADLALNLVLLDSPLPLGKPGLSAENHPFHAPDAPGKDRMDPQPEDRWRAPFGEGVIYEAVKWRFLARARAVLTLDVTDLLAPAADNAFDRCVAEGVVLLAGRRIYPWRIRKGAEARFGDHICTAFDLSRAILRWGVDPAAAGLENTWRMIRVSYAKPQVDRPVPFWRAMAIRVPGRSPAELAPKTALVENPALLSLAETLGHSPLRAPVSAPRAAPAAASEGGRTAIVTTMKNEGPFILEWLAYHRSIGVDDFLIYTNDCTDGTDTMLDLLQAKGFVQHRVNPFKPGGALKPQHAALQAAEAEPVMQTCGWGICMDVDEFIDIKIGDGTLPALYAAMGDANMIALTWRLFGNAEVGPYEDRFITEQFTRCAPELIRKPHQAWGFKTLFRNIDIYKKLGVHRPKGLVPDLWDQVKWLNGSGQPLPRTMFRNGWRSTVETYGYDWVQLNHYAVRSAESFLVKRDRGRVNHVDRDQGLNYWFRMNHNVEEDRSILPRLPRAQAEFARLMADPQIAAAHAHSVACHREKITQLRATETYARFYAELTGARMQRLCRLQPHFGSAVFAAGPEVIPDDVTTRDLPADFFFTVRHDGEAEH